MMMEVVVFALVLVLAQLAVTVGMMCLVFSNWFMKKMAKKSMEMSMVIMKAVDELEEEL